MMKSFVICVIKARLQGLNPVRQVFTIQASEVERFKIKSDRHSLH